MQFVSNTRATYLRRGAVEFWLETDGVRCCKHWRRLAQQLRVDVTISRAATDDAYLRALFELLLQQARTVTDVCKALSFVQCTSIDDLYALACATENLIQTHML
jgi:hypothetical protein